ncbi:MAG: LPS-assembly protein LptD [Methylococcales symbiont of Hymedesmia sp. n. MRB-2018]|nr:MAG: LPS-assembly protein LptD [Methylococcales symbiont of Hymedesmia sp. n. MRB-2018]KAF3983632.1 MAG: LPS-assembly protein LptD [Methylococcales symbiont of Hymedesmia sp. n. MRB-2018]
MHCRLLIFIFLFIYSRLGLANSGVWNCEKVKGQEWSCFGGENKATEIQNGDVLSVQPESRPVKILAPPEPAKTKPKQQAVYVTPPDTTAKRLDWTCKANDENGTSNCRLIGADPKGKDGVVSDPDAYNSFFASAFDYNQEQVFKTLQSQLKYDPWQSCLVSSKDGSQYILGKDLRDTAPMDVSADYSEVFDKEITSFFGNVEIIRADQKVLSDMASYDTVSETMDAQGHVYYSEHELSLYSDTALLNLRTDEARLRKAMFISPSAPLRGSADVVYQDSKLLSRYTNAAFTSCRPGNQDWVVHAQRLKMNKETGKASAKHAWLEFKGVPVLYTPYISLPLDDRRITGLLAPSFGNDEDNGFDAVIPYYWSIAPNYDLTVWPRYMSKRGAMLSGDFRYLTKMNEGSLGLEYLPYDLIEDKPRYSGHFQDKARYTENLSSDIDLNYVSDSDYFDDLNDALGIATDRFLKSRATFNYNQQGVAFRTHLETYQTTDQDVRDNSKPYQKLPQVSLNLNHSFDEWPVDLAMDNEYVYFYRDGRVQGQRFNVKPSIELPLETASGFIKPKISLQHTQYILEDQIEGKADDISRTLPIFSVDGGLIFEKDVNFANSKYLHTIEPRLFYLYIPEDDQEDIPIFDTALNDFNFSSLFRENRFSGTDRVQDANQVTMALTTRLIDAETGQERLNLSLGNIFYFKDRVVTLRENDATETNNFSNVVAELSGQLTDHFSFSSGLQWNPDINDIERGQIEFRYRNQPGQLVNLGYRYRRDNPDRVATIIQTDASMRWPIYDNWFGVGRWQYSLKNNLSTESYLGLEKESCCWRFRVLWRRFAEDNDSSDNETDQGVFVQLELKGLASFGDAVDDFLEKNLKGYLRPE